MLFFWKKIYNINKQNSISNQPLRDTQMLTEKLQKKHPLAMIALLLALCLWFIGGVANAGEILLSEVGSGQWQVSASDLNNVQALDLQLNYDPQRLPSLTVTSGPGLTSAMSAINDKVPGVIRLGVASSQALPQNGILLKLQSLTPGTELRVNLFTVKAVDGNGKFVPTTVRQQLTAMAAPSPVATETVTTPNLPQPLIVTPRRGGYAGSVTLPTESSSEETERMPAPPLPLPAPEQKRTEAPASTTTASTPAFSGPEKRFHSQEEIVTAIERLPRPWTVAAIKSIFLKPASASQVRQVPAVALADGKSRVSLYLPKSLSQKTPTVAVQGCTLGSIWDAKEEGWEVELITRSGIWPGKALLLGEKDLVEFPLVIVPVLTITPPASDKETIPARDFDGNGDISALDAYLYVGNLLTR